MFVGASINLVTCSGFLEFCSAKPNIYLDAEPGDFGWLRAAISWLRGHQCRFDS